MEYILTKRLIDYLKCNNVFIDITLFRQQKLQAFFTTTIASLDSYQLLYFQELINTDNSIDKLIVSPEYKVTTIDVPSVPPTNITATPLSDSEIQLTWNAIPSEYSFGVITGYIVFYRKLYRAQDPYVPKPSITLSKTIIGLDSETIYVFRLLAYTEYGNGVASPQVIAETLTLPPCIPPPFLNAVGIGPMKIYIEWGAIPQKEMNGKPIGYIIKYNASTTEDYGNVSIPYTKRSITLDNLFPEMRYIIDVCGENKAGTGPCIRNMTQTLTSPPSAAPRNINFRLPKEPNSMVITWEMLPLNRIHGDLMGYNLTYHLSRVGFRTFAGPIRHISLHPSVLSFVLRKLQYGSQYTFRIQAVNQHGAGVFSEYVIGQTCVCPPTAYSNYALLKPYIYRDKEAKLTGIFPAILDKLIRQSCGICKLERETYQTSLHQSKNGKNGWSEKRFLNDVQDDLDKYTTVSYPVLVKPIVNDFLGGSYVPVMDHPGSVFVVRKISIQEQVSKMVEDILRVYPILVVVFCILIVIGIAIWGLEHNANESIRTSFLGGVCDSSWSVFITMGTVGYGDVLPITIRGRLLMIFWSFASLIVTSLLIGTVSTALLSADAAKMDVKLYGTNIAVVQDTNEYRVGVIRNALVNQVDTYTTLEQISDALFNDDVLGLLVDAYSAGTQPTLFNRSNMETKTILYYPTSYGLVLTGPMENAADFFKDYIASNQQEILKIINQNAVKMELDLTPKPVISIFSEKSPAMQQALIIVCSGLVAATVVGIILWLTICKKMDRNKQKTYDRTKRDQEELLEILKDFKSQLERDTEILERQHLHDRIRFTKRHQPDWKQRQNSVTMRLLRQCEHHVTYDKRELSLDKINLLYI